MTRKYLRDFELQNIRSQQERNDLHLDLTNMQRGFNADMKRVSDCLNYQMKIEQQRYQRLLAMIQENKNAQIKRERVEKLKNIFGKLKKQQGSALKELHDLADSLDLHFRRIQKAKIAGSSVSISGGVLVIVGLALIPVSFGASTIISIIGGVLTGGGGMTIGGSSIVETVLSSKKRDSVKKILNDYNTTLNEVKVECLEIGQILNNSSDNMTTEYKTWCSFWSKLALGVTTTSAGSWGAIVNPIMKSLRLASIGEDVAAAGFRGISVAGRAFTIAGGVVGILLLPLDIYTLVDSAIDVHKKYPHKVSIKIREICDKINNDFPTDDEIKHMIDDTFNRSPISMLDRNSLLML